MKNNTQSKLKTLLIFCLFLVAVCTTGCTKEEMKKVYNAEGGSKAFNNGTAKIASGSKITYYYVGITDADMAKAFSYAISKADNLTSKVSLTCSTMAAYKNSNYTAEDGYYYYKFVQDYSGFHSPDMENNTFSKYKEKQAITYPGTRIGDITFRSTGWNGLNRYNANGYLNNSAIFFNLDLVQQKTIDYKKMLAMHEIGHSFGLIDFASTSYVYKYDATLMRCDDGWKSTFTDYTDFDKACIREVYDGIKPTF